MAKKPKAIELVFKAQPMMALLLELMKKHNNDDVLVKNIEKWIDDSHEVLKRKER